MHVCLCLVYATGGSTGTAVGVMVNHTQHSTHAPLLIHDDSHDVRTRRLYPNRRGVTAMQHETSVILAKIR